MLLRSACLAFWMALAGSALQAQDWARQLFEVSSHDFGSVARGAKAEFTFVLTNNLVADVHIASVRSSCGCTTPRIETPLLKTYEKGAIVAHLNSGNYLGRRAATLTVTIDQPAFAEVQLQIRAFVHEDVLMDPPGIELGSVEEGAAAANKVTIYRSGLPDWKISEVKWSNPNLFGQVFEVARQDNQVWYELRVRLTPTASPGYLKDHVILVTNDPNAAEIPVAVEGQVQPRVTLSPESLFLGIMRPGEKVTKQLVVRAKEPFRVTSVSGDPTSFEFAQPSGEAKLLHLIPVTFVAGAEWGKVVKTVHIQTDVQKAPIEASTYAVVEPEK